MTTSRTLIANKAKTHEKISRGEFAYVCSRNQLHAHNLLLRAVRDSGLSQKQLAERAGIDEAALSRLMRRPQNVEINTLSKLVYAAVGAALKLTTEFPENRAEIIVITTDYQVQNTRNTKFLPARSTPLHHSDLCALKLGNVEPWQFKSTAERVYARN